MSIFKSLANDLQESEKVSKRQQIIHELRPNISSDSPFFSPLLFDVNQVGQKNCENLVGQVSLPVGVAGPLSATLKIGTNSSSLTDLLIPLATTEGALVASINRGTKLLSQVNPAVSIKNVGMTRAPVFACQNEAEALKLAAWIKLNLPKLADIAETTSTHLTYLNCHIITKKNLVFTRIAFDTDQAMGMNMVTLALDPVVKYILSNNSGVTCPALSSNICTDKKTSALTRRLGRGRWVTVTAQIPSALIESVLKTTNTDLLSTYYAKIVVGSKLAGLAGANMQIANVAAAILTATGQDLAHTVDISQGTLTLKAKGDGIFAKLSLPSVPVGTVGGGTVLATQSTARNLISELPVSSDILAAVIGLGSLSGELSGLAALSTHSLALAHAQLAR